MVSVNLAELEISLHLGDSGLYDLDFRFGLPESNLHLEQTKIKLDSLELSRAGLGASDYAQKLTDQLFVSQEVKTAFMRALDISRARDIPLNIRLIISKEASDLHNLHWEALLDPQDGFPLFTRSKVLFSRFLSSRRLRPINRRSRDQIRALVVVANPSDLSEYPQLAAIDVRAEFQLAHQGLSGLPIVKIPGKDTNQYASMKAILECLRGHAQEPSLAGFDILYLVCHGTLREDEPYVWLQNEDGLVARVPGAELARRLEELEQPPSLVILASCESAGNEEGMALNALGPRLVEAGIPAVLAMQGKISMETVSRFMPVFFEELTRDGQIHRAIAVARGEVRERSDWWMPVLFSCLRDNRLFDMPAGETANIIQRQYFEPETVYIPAGAFLMGRADEHAGSAFESPQHEVFLPAFRIGKYPVTNAQYEVFINQTNRPTRPEMGWDGQIPPTDKKNHPVVGVAWFDALAYCEWLSEQTGRGYSLPNEAQWEKAARGRDGRLYPWGDTWEPERCNHGNPEISPVDYFPLQSPYGCFDMVGNVRQWTATLWGEKRLEPDFRYRYPYPRVEDGRNDLTALTVIRRVYRGGAALDPLGKLYCFSRHAYAPEKSGPPGKRHGFRVVMIL